MAAIEITGLDDLIKGLGILATDQIPFATAKTLTQVAGIGKTNLVAEMQRVFDRPTNYTLNAFTVQSATKSALTSKVKLKDTTKGEKHYLNPEAAAGKRVRKLFEAALNNLGKMPIGYVTVPSHEITLDAYGNVPKSMLDQMLKYFRESSAGPTAAKLAKSTIRKYGFDYFVIMPGQNKGLHAGIWMHVYSNFGRAIKPVLMFVRDATYQQKLNVERIADETYNKNFDDLFKQNFIDAVNTAIPKK